jgi:hypothetical protein
VKPVPIIAHAAAANNAAVIAGGVASMSIRLERRTRRRWRHPRGSRFARGIPRDLPCGNPAARRVETRMPDIVAKHDHDLSAS